MKTGPALLAWVKPVFRGRPCRSSFLVVLCLVIYLGYAVGTGQIFIHLDAYRGVYNAAWIGSLMALVITFFLGIFGFFLVKNNIVSDERTGVGQIIATTSLSRQKYLIGKWLSNVAVLTVIVAILAGAALLILLIRGEDTQLHLWSLLAPFLFIAFPMMTLVAAFAVFFETISWLKGGFGNLVYFFLFIMVFMAGLQLTRSLWLDVVGFNLVGTGMKTAVKEVFPTYSGNFVLTMASKKSLETFVWAGLDWTLELMLLRLLWPVISLGVVLIGSLFFNRFDPARPAKSKSNPKRPFAEDAPMPEEIDPYRSDVNISRLTPLALDNPFHFNFWRLVWLECVLLLKGSKWYWLAGMALLWLGWAAPPFGSVRNICFMFAAIWPVLVWAKMGERDVRYHTEQFIYQAPYPEGRLLGSAWLAGVVITAVAASGVLLGRIIYGESLALLPWMLSVLFIPTLALTLGIWSRSSKLFEVVYPILWYLGPFNTQNQLVVLDYLGIHSQAPVNTSPLWFAGFILLLILLAIIGRRQPIYA